MWQGGWDFVGDGGPEALGALMPDPDPLDDYTRLTFFVLLLNVGPSKLSICDDKWCYLSV